MNVLLINGSPNREGCTYTALAEIADELNKNGVQSEIYHIGNAPIRGCMGCNRCLNQTRCIFNDDSVNVAIEKAQKADGFIFGSPVYYASANGAMISFLDRFFYAASSYCAYKPAAVVASARRAGTTATYDQLNKYIGISKMIMVPSPYWNMVHGNTPDEVRKDEEGLYVMRELGRNMAWLLQILQSAKENNIAAPKEEEHIYTNFIR